MRFTLFVALGITFATSEGILNKLTISHNPQSQNWEQNDVSSNNIVPFHRRLFNKDFHYRGHGYGYPRGSNRFVKNHHRGYRAQSTSESERHHHHYRHRLSDHQRHFQNGDRIDDDHFSNVKVYKLRDLVSVDHRPYEFYQGKQFPVEHYLSSRARGQQHPDIEQYHTKKNQYENTDLVSRLFRTANKLGAKRRRRRHHNRRKQKNHKIRFALIPTEILSADNNLTSIIQPLANENSKNVIETNSTNTETASISLTENPSNITETNNTTSQNPVTAQTATNKTEPTPLPSTS